MKAGKVLIITGPAASGKTTLANLVAQLPGWMQISEDEYWGRHGWGGHRNEEQERTVQTEVSEDLRKLTQEGKNVVLEFILYKLPPNPLSFYIEQLKALGINFDVVVLKPDVETIIERMVKRGRASDLAEMKTRKTYAISQIACLNDTSIKPEWVINPAGLTADKLFESIGNIPGLLR